MDIVRQQVGEGASGFEGQDFNPDESSVSQDSEIQRNHENTEKQNLEKS